MLSIQRPLSFVDPSKSRVEGGGGGGGVPCTQNWKLIPDSFIFVQGREYKYYCLPTTLINLMQPAVTYKELHRWTSETKLSGSSVAQQRVERLGHGVQERTRAAGHRGDTQTTCQQSHTGS